MIAAVFGEWQRIGSWLYYALAGIAIAAVGFLAQFWAEAAGVCIVNTYAVTAFIVTGFVAGMVYWLFSGRNASGYDEPGGSVQEIIPPPRSTSPAGGPAGPAARAAWRAAT